jgi:hypothetical protein
MASITMSKLYPFKRRDFSLGLFDWAVYGVTVVPFDNTQHLEVSMDRTPIDDRTRSHARAVTRSINADLEGIWPTWIDRCDGANVYHRNFWFT